MIISDIEQALSHKLHYLALMVAVTLPDICAALETKTGASDGGLYRKWYKKHLKQKMGYLSPNDCYSLRCGVLHQGRMGVANQDFARVIFTIPETPVRMKSCIANDAMIYDVEFFCTDIIQAVREWFATAKDDPHVKANLANLVHYRPGGLAPYVVGAPIIG